MNNAKLLQTGLVAVIGYVLIFILVWIINKQVKNLKARPVLRKNVVYIVSILMILAIAFLWMQNLNSLTIFISVIGAGLAWGGGLMEAR